MIVRLGVLLILWGSVGPGFGLRVGLPGVSFWIHVLWVWWLFGLFG